MQTKMSFLGKKWILNAKYLLGSVKWIYWILDLPVNTHYSLRIKPIQPISDLQIPGNCRCWMVNSVPFLMFKKSVFPPMSLAFDISVMIQYATFNQHTCIPCFIFCGHGCVFQIKFEGVHSNCLLSYHVYISTIKIKYLK